MTPAQEAAYLAGYRRAIAALDNLTPEDMLNAFAMSAMSRPDEFTMKDTLDDPNTLDVISFRAGESDSGQPARELTLTVTTREIAKSATSLQSDSAA